MSSAAVDHCVLSSPTLLLPGDLEQLPCTDKLYGDADFFFQQDLVPANSAKSTTKWFSEHDINVLG